MTIHIGTQKDTSRYIYNSSVYNNTKLEMIHISINFRKARRESLTATIDSVNCRGSLQSLLILTKLYRDYTAGTLSGIRTAVPYPARILICHLETRIFPQKILVFKVYKKRVLYQMFRHQHRATRNMENQGDTYHQNNIIIFQ